MDKKRWSLVLLFVVLAGGRIEATDVLTASEVLRKRSEGCFEPPLFASYDTIHPDAFSELVCWPGGIIDLSSVAEWKRADLETLVTWKHGRQRPTVLDLSGLKSLTPEVASILAIWRGGTLRLNGLELLSEESARALAGQDSPFFATLELNGLRRLPIATATALSRIAAKEIRLRGVKNLSAESFSSLCLSNVRRLEVSGFSRIDSEYGSAMASFQGHTLVLPDVVEITQDGVEQVQSWRGDNLVCESLEVNSDLARRLIDKVRHQYWHSMDENLARVLVRRSRTGFGMQLDLRRLQTLSPGVAQVLATASDSFLDTRVGKLRLKGLKSISASDSEILSKYDGTVLDLSGLEMIDEEVAYHLGGSTIGELDLSGLRELTLSQIQAWTRNGRGRGRRVIRLNGLRTLSDTVAAELAKASGSALYLNGLTEISYESARLLAANRSCQLHLDGLLKLDLQLASILAAHRTGLPSLNGVREIQVDSARAIASARGNELRLGGLARLDPESARELARWKGRNIYLGVTQLGAEQMKALANWRGSHLYLNRLGALSLAEAEAIGSWKTNVRGMTGPVLEMRRLLSMPDKAVLALGKWNGILISPNHWVVGRKVELERAAEGSDR